LKAKAGVDSRPLRTLCGIYPLHRKRVTSDHFGSNVYYLHDLDPAGIPVRGAAGAAMP